MSSYGVNDGFEDELGGDVFSRSLEDNDEEEHDVEEDIMSLDDWTQFTLEDDSPTLTRIYLFGRTGREKEDWFRRLCAATHQNGYDEDDADERHKSETLIEQEQAESEYRKFMSKFEKFSRKKDKTDQQPDQEATSDHSIPSVLWLNSLIARVMFDCLRDPSIKTLITARLQRKLSSIKLPYFVEQIILTELVLGNTSPLIHTAGEPMLDNRGLWIDLEVTYEGLLAVTMQTKLNLMKLKQPPPTDRKTEEDVAAKWRSSDVEDSAETSTDDDVLPRVLDSAGLPIPGLGGKGNFVNFLDKIGESRIFQVATDMRYIKKAMEGVSNTDLTLKVDLKGLTGTLAINIPPPPSDRIWYGFRPTPKLTLSVRPMFGDSNVPFVRYLSKWFEKKAFQEFQKNFVIPNMEDLMVPLMSPNLPV